MTATDTIQTIQQIDLGPLDLPPINSADALFLPPVPADFPRYGERVAVEIPVKIGRHLNTNGPRHRAEANRPMSATRHIKMQTVGSVVAMPSSKLSQFEFRAGVVAMFLAGAAGMLAMHATAFIR